MSLHGAALVVMGGIVAGAFVATLAKETGLTKKVEDKAKEVYDGFQKWKAEKEAEKAVPVTVFDTRNGRIIRRDNGEAQWDMAKPEIVSVSLDHCESVATVRWKETKIFSNADYAILEMRTKRLLEYLESIQFNDKHTLADYVSSAQVHGEWSEENGSTIWTTDIYFVSPCGTCCRCTSGSAMAAVDKFTALLKG